MAPAVHTEGGVAGKEAAMIDRVVELARSVGRQVGAIIPEDLAVCEFECREIACTAADWRDCQRRRAMRPGGTDLRYRSRDDTGLKL